MSTYQQARLVLDDTEHSQFDSVSVKFPGNSKLNTFTCTLNDSEMQESKLLNKELKFYLNYGSEDSVPVFRGYIRQVNPSDKDIKITAYDGRTYIQGKESQTISLTDKDNFDGYTVSQYLSSIIKDKVNVEGRTRIGLNMLNETSPPVLMKNVRGKNQSPYNLALKQLKTSNDKDTINDGVIYRYNIDMIDDGNTSNIVFVKDKSLDDIPSVTFAYLDGISKYKNKNRAVPSYVTASTKDGRTVHYQDGNLPRGLIGATVKGNYEDTASATEAAYFEVLYNEKSTSEITLTATKGFYIGLGSIVRLSVSEEELSLINHRVVSKSIKYSVKTGSMCSLVLNRQPVLVSDYIRSS